MFHAVKNNKVVDLDPAVFNVSANLKVKEAIKTLGDILSDFQTNVEPESDNKKSDISNRSILTAEVFLLHSLNICKRYVFFLLLLL